MGQIDQDLYDASKNGDLEEAKQAIENGADVNVKDKNGDTPPETQLSLYYCWKRVLM
jgi:ankyrin repeat protein